MRRIVHSRIGMPSEVLKLVDVPDPVGAAGGVLVRVTHAPIHPGDLLGIEGSPAFGPPPAIPAGGRGPGFEGAGIVDSLGPDVDPAHGLSVGDRVAFFPAGNVWSDLVPVSAASVVKLPPDVSQEVGAHMLINAITARILLRAGHAAVAGNDGAPLVAIQTGAASAVGRLLTTLLLEAGVRPVRIVRSRDSVSALAAAHPGAPTVATEDPGWEEGLRVALDGVEPLIAYDSVGGDMIGRLGAFLRRGATVISYGSLGGAATDIRSIVPRRLIVRGVTIDQWSEEAEEVRSQDVEKAVELARVHPELFGVAGEYAPGEIAEAVDHVLRPGKSGTVLLRFG